MLDTDPTDTPANETSGASAGNGTPAPRKRAPRKAAKAAAPPASADAGTPAGPAAADPDVAGAGPVPAKRTRRSPRKAQSAAEQPVEETAAEQPAAEQPAAEQPAAEQPRPARKTARRAAKKIAVTAEGEASVEGAAGTPTTEAPAADAPPAPRKRTRKATQQPADTPPGVPADTDPAASATAESSATDGAADAPATPALAAPGVLFMAPPVEAARPAARAAKKATKKTSKKVAKKAPRRAGAAPATGPEDDALDPTAADAAQGTAAQGAPDADADADADARAPLDTDETADLTDDTADDAPDADAEDLREIASEQASGARRRRRRGRRGRGGARGDGDADQGAESTGDSDTDTDTDTDADTGSAEGDGAPADAGDAGDAKGGDKEDDASSGTGTSRRRRRRRSSSADGDATTDDPPNTVTHVRDTRRKGGDSDDGVRGVKGSTRLEAKRQRRRDGRDTSRRRAPILTEAEFLARREAVDRVMAVRQSGDRTQIAVLEDDILVEHYVTRASATSYVGNVYLGRVQNVLPSMEAAFVDIGKGRNGVLYAGEVNWDAAGLEGKSRAIENALKSGDTVLVQVTKDPIGHKGARLTSQVSLPGRFLVLVPGGGMTGISRRLPDTERHRLKAILKKIVPEDAGVIVRTAAEGASEEDLTRDVERLTAQWAQIEQAAKTQSGSGPKLVHGEPDLAIRVVRDVFNEDFASLVVQGEDVWQTVSEYIEGVAPDLAQRVSRHTGTGDLFHDLRIDEQIMKALDRKVWLPSGGSLVIDRTEAMTVIDVNTGKFVGSGGNLEQTVTRNNIEAAEEIVRQLRLRDVGGIVVIDFIDMVLESNRELVLRRLTECLGRDRTKHQVAEVTSLGLVQMTRKRVGEGLLEAFSEPCEHCHGRGVMVHAEPVDKRSSEPADAESAGASRGGKRRRSGRGGSGSSGSGSNGAAAESAELPPVDDERRRAANAAIAAIHRAAGEKDDEDGTDSNGAGGLDALASGLVAAARNATGAGTADGHGTRPEPAPEPVGAVAAAETAVETATETPVETPVETPAPAPRRRRRAASRPAGPPGSV